jgi:hypothetical protein
LDRRDGQDSTGSEQNQDRQKTLPHFLLLPRHFRACQERRRRRRPHSFTATGGRSTPFPGDAVAPLAGAACCGMNPARCSVECGLCVASVVRRGGGVAPARPRPRDDVEVAPRCRPSRAEARRPARPLRREKAASRHRHPHIAVGAAWAPGGVGDDAASLGIAV